MAAKKTNGECSVSVSMGYTFNMDNYESYRIQSGITVPCTEKTLSKKYKEAYKFVDDRVKEEYKLVRRGRK